LDVKKKEAAWITASRGSFIDLIIDVRKIKVKNLNSSSMGPTIRILETMGFIPYQGPVKLYKAHSQ
jgi:hypothetical protein